MLVIEFFDELANMSRPIKDDSGITSITPRLIAELPGKDCRATLIAIYEESDVVFVHSLTAFIGIPRCGVTTEGISVRFDASEIRPVEEISSSGRSQRNDLLTNC